MLHRAPSRTRTAARIPPVETILDELQAFPRFLVRALDELGDPGARRRPDPAGWSLDEQLWHLADLEREAWSVRIERVLAEEAPALADFDGNAAAAARDYNAKDPYNGLLRFQSARQSNLARLRALSAREWQRTGVLEHVGSVSLAQIAQRMHEHDLGHRREIEALLHPRGSVA